MVGWRRDLAHRDPLGRDPVDHGDVPHPIPADHLGVACERRRGGAVERRTVFRLGHAGECRQLGQRRIPVRIFERCLYRIGIGLQRANERAPDGGGKLHGGAEVDSTGAGELSPDAILRLSGLRCRTERNCIVRRIRRQPSQLLSGNVDLGRHDLDFACEYWTRGAHLSRDGLRPGEPEDGAVRGRDPGGSCERNLDLGRQCGRMDETESDLFAECPRWRDARVGRDAANPVRRGRQRRLQRYVGVDWIQLGATGAGDLAVRTFRADNDI